MININSVNISSKVLISIQNVQGVPKNALSDSSSCKPTPQRDQILYKHQQLFHQGEECQFSFQAERFFKDAMSHQIYEGVCINNSPSTPGYLMNSRAEYEQGAVARLNVQHGL